MLSVSKKAVVRVAPYVALAVSILLNTAALIAIRAAVGRLDTGAPSLSIDLLWKVLSDIWFWAGGLSFVAGMYFWIISLKTIDLSLAYPASSISYVLIAVVSYYFFNEPITIARITGMVLVIGGVVLLFEKQEAASP
jgi:multidrug transporter EmrE-like cation transporter